MPLTTNDFEFFTGTLNQNEFLGTLFTRDDQAELGEKSFATPKPEDAKVRIKQIEGMSFQDLKRRLITHAKLSSAFRHFQLLRLEPFEEKLRPKHEEIPFLLTKNCMLERYSNGKSLNNFVVVYLNPKYGIYTCTLN